jgi:predicted polyphosphate/ATP-dependent NAD kinase
VTARRQLGVVVNPIAGMGGRVGLHGTDGTALAAARARGAEPVAALRARRALTRLHARTDAGLAVLSAGGEMGADLLAELDWPHTTVHRPAAPPGPEDTRRTVEALRAAGVDLLLFVGGDGTARDVVAALGPTEVAVLGVPAGVKMHSGVFATSPEAAADTAAAFLADPDRVGTTAADVVDVLDGAAPTLLGTAWVPATSGGLQQAKATAPTSGDADLAALGREIAAEMDPHRLYLLGPGSTVAHVGTALGLPTSPLGVDAVLDGQLLGTDLGETQLRALVAAHPGTVLVLGVVGGQGFLLGRGNQQLSPAVVEAIGADNITILAAAGKVAALDPPVLRVDLGDAAPAVPLTGYRRVRTGPGHSTVLQIVA